MSITSLRNWKLIPFGPTQIKKMHDDTTRTLLSSSSNHHPPGSIYIPLYHLIFVNIHVCICLHKYFNIGQLLQSPVFMLGRRKSRSLNFNNPFIIVKYVFIFKHMFSVFTFIAAHLKTLCKCSSLFTLYSLFVVYLYLMKWVMSFAT